MTSEVYFTSTALCVACLSSGRRLALVTDSEIKQMFSDYLDNSEFSHHPIPLCYECTRRLNSALCFKKQVKTAHKFLIDYTINSELPTSMSKLQIRKTETYEYTPDIPHESDRDVSVKNVSSFQNHVNNLHSDIDQLSDSYETDSIYFDYADDIKNKSKKVNRTLKGEIETNSKRQVNKPEDVKTSRRPILEVKLENSTENPLNYIKDEPEDAVWNCNSLDLQLKAEKREDGFSDSDDEPLKAKRKRTKKVKKEGAADKRERASGVVSGVWVQRKLNKLNVPPGLLEMVVLSWEEVELERQKCLSHITYTRHEFRCPTCIVGFNHRFKLETHMKKHQPEAGDLECSICKTRFKNQCSLTCHRRRHRSRWRCVLCRALFSRAGIAADHHAKVHGAVPPTHTCHVCRHEEPSLYKLRIHMKSHAERQHCEQCGKTFRDKSSLKTHLYIHTNQKDFVCEVCDKRFRFKKALEIHRVTHQAPELLYCTDCDMNFKNQHSFYQHMKYSMKHIHPDKIKYACEFCERRFSKPARLEEHRLSIHLKLSPHRCSVEGCTFASASRPALRSHTRMVHRNKRLERNHICHHCGKAYTTKKILEGHIRSHTGERPFICSHCPATFSHDAALYNHNKLVHKVPFVRRRKPIQQAPEVQPQIPEVQPPTEWTVPVEHEASVPTDSERTHN